MAAQIPFAGIRYDYGQATAVADALQEVLVEARLHAVTPPTLLAALGILGASIIVRSRTGLSPTQLVDAVRDFTLAVLATQAAPPAPGS